MTTRRQQQHTELRNLPTQLVEPCQDCGKVRYMGRKAAKAAGRLLYPGKHMSAYQCGEWWHIGNAPAWLIAGGGEAGRLAEAERRRPAPSRLE